MKYLLLFLVSFNTLAEWKVNILNREGQSLSKNGFSTEAEAQSFIDTMKHRWGQDQRWTQSFCLDNTGFRVVEREGENVTEYDCPQNYTATIEDITLQRTTEKKQADLQINKKCGAEVVDFITLRNGEKEILPTQVDAIFAKYSIIINMLTLGSLTTAIYKISTSEVDELFTLEDKDAILTKINSCKAN